MRRHRTGGDPTYVSMMPPVGHEEDGLGYPLVEHGRDHGQVGQVGSTSYKINYSIIEYDMH